MKILYLMAIDWNWIKQRPQFLVYELSKNNQVDVLYLHEIFGKIQLQNNNAKVNNCKAIPAIPLRDRNIFFSGIQKVLFLLKIRKYKKYDAIWISYPSLIKYIPQKYQGIVIYDCMDYHAAMCKNKRIQYTINTTEKKLVMRADIIFASSNYLMQHMKKLGGYDKTILVRNGFSSDQISNLQHENKKEIYKIAYVGTIAEWFDFELLLNSLKIIRNIEYHLLGPKAMEIPQNENIIYDGVCEHSELMNYGKTVDCMFMPFKVNDIIKAVDPVKLYEYISMGTCIISVYYEEIKQFEPFVYFYETLEEYSELLNKLIKNGFQPKYTKVMQEKFLKSSTWEARGNIIEKEIVKLEFEKGLKNA